MRYLPLLVKPRMTCLKQKVWCKKKNYLVSSCLSQLFKTRNSQYCLRNCDFEMPRFSPTGYGKHTTRYQGLYIWLQPSKELKMSPTMATFKTSIRKIIIDLSRLIDNNSSCCKLCKLWLELFYMSFYCILCYAVNKYLLIPTFHIQVLSYCL